MGFIVGLSTSGLYCQRCRGGWYLYKDSLSVSLLGLVDDVTGVTEAGFKAQQLNAILNVKSAEKGLQYGVKK